MSKWPYTPPCGITIGAESSHVAADGLWFTIAKGPLDITVPVCERHAVALTDETGSLPTKTDEYRGEQLLAHERFVHDPAAYV